VTPPSLAPLTIAELGGELTVRQHESGVKLDYLPSGYSSPSARALRRPLPSAVPLAYGSGLGHVQSAAAQTFTPLANSSRLEAIDTDSAVA
jgi:hypothetical protein